MARELLAGWGRTAPSAADVVRPAGPDLAAVAAVGPARGMIARGLGRSYGDAAQNAGGTVVVAPGADRPGWVDAAAGLVRAPAGTSLGDLLRFLVPQGWTVPVSPGTSHVTVGGAIAADIHGKNHVADGSFARYVTAFTLATPAGVTTVTPEGDGELFWATTGGLGLTGLVLDATLRAVPIETAAVVVVTERGRDLDDLMARTQAAAGRHRYAVAWVDALARGRGLGRGVVTGADHAAVADLAPARRADPLALAAAGGRSVPDWFPGGLLRPAAVGAFNRLVFRRTRAEATTTVEALPGFLCPLDALGGWNRLYGRAGLVQYQFAVPYEAADVVRVALERLGRARCPGLLTVLKCLGPADPGPLSFPMPGWTLAVDLPAAAAGLSRALDQLDEVVAAAGGRVYLAKDSRLRPDLVGAMYPQLPAWRRVKARVDPDGVFTSDLGRRLGLAGPG